MGIFFRHGDGTYARNTVFSSIDHQGRYAFGNQPHMVRWNLTRFAETLLPLLHPDQKRAVEIASEAIEEFNVGYEKQWLAMMRNKLGLLGEEMGDESLVTELLAWMEQVNADYTNTFRSLISEKFPAEKIFLDGTFKKWHQRWRLRQL